jgi:hypothetical protein
VRTDEAAGDCTDADLIALIRRSDRNTYRNELVQCIHPLPRRTPHYLTRCLFPCNPSFSLWRTATRALLVAQETPAMRRTAWSQRWLKLLARVVATLAEEADVRVAGSVLGVQGTHRWRAQLWRRPSRRRRVHRVRRNRLSGLGLLTRVEAQW